jgi:hypothetical protein
MVFVMGYGMSTHGVFPCLGLIVRICKSINKEEYIVEVVVLELSASSLSWFVQKNVCA